MMESKSRAADVTDTQSVRGVRGRVSVVIPCYNQAHYLGACIDSVLAQQLDDCEIIVVNDGSSDDTDACARRYLPRIVYVAQPNRGLSNARNTGFAHASGEFVQFLDSDDLLGAGAIARRMQALTGSGADIAVCPNRLFTELDARQRPQVTGQWRLPGGSFDVHLCFANIAPPHAYLIRRPTVLASAPFDEGLRACEDFDFILRAIMGGARLVRTASALVYYRRHATSMSANLTNQYRHDVILQGRLHDVLLVARSYPQQRLAAKLLAYMAGLTLSLLRAEWLRGEDIALLGRYLDEATQALARLPAEHDFHGHYYAALLSRHLRRLAPSVTGAPWRTAMDGAATQALRHGGGIHSIWTAADGASLYERLRYARLRLAP